MDQIDLEPAKMTAHACSDATGPIEMNDTPFNAARSKAVPGCYECNQDWTSKKMEKLPITINIVFFYSIFLLRVV